MLANHFRTVLKQQTHFNHYFTVAIVHVKDKCDCDDSFVDLSLLKMIGRFGGFGFGNDLCRVSRLQIQTERTNPLSGKCVMWDVIRDDAASWPLVLVYCLLYRDHNTKVTSLQLIYTHVHISMDTWTQWTAACYI